MRVALLTAASINGIITGKRGRDAHELGSFFGVPQEVLEHKASLRRRYDAVLVGTETVRIVDPTLTSHAAAGSRPVRVTLDRTGRLPRTARIFDGSARTLVGVCAETPSAYLDFLRTRNIEAIPAGREGIDLATFLNGLAAREIGSVVCEGGGALNRSLLAADLVERIHLLLLPAVLDGGAVNLFEGYGIPVKLKLEGVERLGGYLWLDYAVG